MSEEFQEEAKKFITYNITNHALERYAQRMVNKDNPTDIRTYINNHRNDIKEWIGKLINYGELLYEGRLKDYPVNQVFYKDFWVIIVDPKTKNVITLYKIDLGDDEVNQLFVSKMIAKINEAKYELEIVKKDVDNKIIEYQTYIDNNAADIKWYQSMIKSLENQNSYYEALIKTLNCQIKKGETNISDLVDTLVSRKSF